MDALTTNEVVALFDLDERRVRKEVEHGVLDASSPPRFALPAVVYLRTLAELGFEMNLVEDRKKLYGLIRSGMTMAPRTLRIELSDITELKLDRVLGTIVDRIERFDAWKQKLVTDDRILGGEPVFPKTRLAVRHVGGMLLKGASIGEVREDYPYLDDDDLELAKVYARAYPLIGRPRERQAPAR